MYIAILSRGPQLYSTQTLFRAAQRKGHKVRIFDHAKFDLLIDNNQPKLLYQGNPISDFDAIIPRIGSSITHYGCMVVRHFEMQNIFSTISSDAILRARDKFRSLQLLSNSGILIPKTIYAKDTYDTKYMIETIGGPPLILKLLEGTHGAGVLLAESYMLAESLIETFTKTNQSFLIQEFISEARGTDIRVFVVNGKIVAAMKRSAKSGDFRSNLHRGGDAIPIQLSRQESLTALKACEILGLKVAGVDMLRSDRGPLLLEVNPSPGLEGIEKTTEVDIAKQIIEYIEDSIP